MSLRELSEGTVLSDVATWLRKQGLDRYIPTFAANAIDWDLLSELTDANLEELGVVLGHRKKLLRAIAALSSTEAREAAGPAQVRQLTVFFSDIVGSTALSQRFDPEDMRSILERYRGVVVGRINEYGGHVASFLGDGVLAYFGWPESHENDGERAVRAGLDVVAAVKTIDIGDGTGLRARVGIATGRVVVGKLGTGGAADAAFATGETPNLAARLQSIADPDYVVIDHTTRSLIGGAFAFSDLGSRELKGFRESVRASRVLGERVARSRFEARDQELTPFINRERERKRLQAEWSRVQVGYGRVLVVSGEPGIGKSRLLLEFQRATAEPATLSLYFQCSPYHLNTAFFPLVRQLERAARFDLNDSPRQKWRKLRVLIKHVGGDAESLSHLASLLSIAESEVADTIDLPPKERRQRLIDALLAGLRSLAVRRPVIVFIEDLHWIDPTSAELLDHLVARIAEQRVLVVLTHRPEWQPRFAAQPRVAKIALSRLPISHVRSVVRAVAGTGVSASLVEKIAARTDGVPLFAEELTRSVLDAKVSTSRPEAEIPETLEASLLSRFDRLGEAKEVVQAGSAIGREFEPSLLAKVCGLTEAQLAAVMQRCIASGLIVRRELKGRPVLAFKHVLVQDAAYRTMLRGARRALHARIADVLCEDYRDAIRSRPEVIARHLTEGGRLTEAISFWQASGDVALLRSAHVEAAVHFETALSILRNLEPTPVEATRIELDLLIRYAGALRATKGFTHPMTGAASARARDLARTLGDSNELLPALQGVYSFHVVRGEHRDSERAARELLAAADAADNETYRMIGLRAVGIVSLHLGSPLEGARHLEEALAQYDESRHRGLALVYGSDHATTCMCFLSMARWVLGETKAAVDCIERGIRYSEQLSHPFSLAQAVVALSLLHTLARDYPKARESAARGMRLAERYSFAEMLSESRFYYAAAQTARRDSRRADAMLAAALRHEETAAGNYRPLLLTLCAEAYSATGDFTRALELLAEAEAATTRSAERWAEAEMLRVRAELLAGMSRLDEAENTFDAAISVSQEQSAKSWELRAVIGRTRLLMDRKRTDGLTALRDLRRRFAYDRTSPDGIAADRLLGTSAL